ncbi:L,D-transpeptidase [Ideonella sp.]|uniref:L,D-transpeptidase n=1 Tax=Ideonella sp. TaxID=1929293 RepID=UPI0035B37B67
MGFALASVAPGGAPSAGTQVDFRGVQPSEEARHAAIAAIDLRDARGRPVAVVDKKNARIYVFGADGRLRGTTPVLLGLTPGDRSAPGVGRLAGGYIPAAMQTTPAGRFESEPGRNLTGESIVWLDYDAALAIHRLRPAHPAQRRPQRLASASTADNRISQGCVIVPGEFFDQVVAPTLGRQRGVVYILPEADQPAEFMQVAGKR